MTNNEELKTIVDKTLQQINGRDLVSAQEVTDLLLDIRLLLLSEEAKTTTI
jgi:hypothetical protein